MRPNRTQAGAASFSIGLLLLIPVAMYFLLIRPQRKRQRAQQEMQSELDVGDEVMTASGIYGFITGFEDDKVWVEIDDDVQIRVNRAFLQGRVGAATPGARPGSGGERVERCAERARPEGDADGEGAQVPQRGRRGEHGRLPGRTRHRRMTRRRLWTSLLCCVGITVTLLLVNIGLGNTPALGLDLQGGVSVVLAPESGASGDDLIVIRDLIRDELENRGIGEPDVRVEGSNIVVDLPGVKDQQDALDAATSPAS